MRAQANSRSMRVWLYERVSSEEQVKGYSLGAQDRANRAWCASYGWQVVAVYRDEGKSARTEDVSKRPDFQRMLTDVDSGLLDVIVVHKLDRFARNRRVAFDAFHRLGKAGVGFVSISENMDYSTPAGQLMLTMLVGMAQFYSDNLSLETKKGKAERKAQGRYNGLLPFGVTKDGEGRPVPHADPFYCDVATRNEITPYRGLVAAFELAATGKTDREIAQALNADGYRTSGNRGANPFSKDTIRPMLQNRFYLGELPDGNGGWLPGKHAPLIDAELFQKAQEKRAANTRRPRRTAGPGRPWALSGVATCGTCGRSLVVNGRPGDRRSIRCSGRIQGAPCDEPSFYEEVVHSQVSAILDRFIVPPDDQARLVELWRQRQGSQPNTRAARARLERRLARLRELYLEGDLEKPAYQAQRATLMDELAALPTNTDQRADAGQVLARLLASVAGAWSVATVDERNRLARQLFADVVIENRTVVAVVPRPDLVPFFQGVTWCEGGSDGLSFLGNTLSEDPEGTMLVVDGVPARRRRGVSGRDAYHTPRVRKLDPATELVVRSLAGTASLRALAAQFGVSHETIRLILLDPAQDEVA